MIILDTNVLSEPLRPQPHERVIGWLDAQAIGTLYLTTIGLAEMRFGIAALAKGKRRRTLGDRFESELVPLFTQRVLSFDEPATRAYADLRARTRAAGTPVGHFDALIAAIAIVHGFAVATRDTEPFEAAGVTVIDPFAG